MSHWSLRKGSQVFPISPNKAQKPLIVPNGPFWVALALLPRLQWLIREVGCCSTTDHFRSAHGDSMGTAWDSHIKSSEQIIASSNEVTLNYKLLLEIHQHRPEFRTWNYHTLP